MPAKGESSQARSPSPPGAVPPGGRVGDLGGARRRPSFGWESLTPAEREVVTLVGEGLRNKDIAAKLLVGEATVKTPLNRVFTKLGVS